MTGVEPVLASTITDVAALLVSISTLVTASATAFVLVRKLAEVKAEVTTGNGQTLAQLADIAEGRAAQAIAPEDRTHDEQHHADMKEAVEGPPVGTPPS